MDFKAMTMRKILACLLSLTVVACGKSSDSPSSDSLSKGSVSKAAMNTDGISFSAPQYVMVSIAGHLALNVPSGVSIVTANWDFGDGTVAQGAGPFDHQFYNIGVSNVSVAVTDSLGTQMTFTQAVNVIQFNELLFCVADLSLTSSDQVQAGTSITLTLSVPACLTALGATVAWNFADGTTTGNSNVASHTFSLAGDYIVSATVSYNNGGVVGSFTLTDDITVTPKPVDPLACPTLNATQQTTGANYTQVNNCGVGGSRTDTYHDLITQTCVQGPTDGVLRWQETSRSKQLVSEGQCMGQACALPVGALTGVSAISQNLIMVGGVYYMFDGTHMNYYSSQTPASLCADVAEVRQCSNGVLSGDTGYTYLLCHNGCKDFGPDGTVKLGVVTGQIPVAHACTYGEPGINDIYSQVSDQTCQLGQVVTTNTHQGDVVTAGVCPNYSWVGTDSWTTCSADCGGMQTQLFRCQDSNGVTADNSRCSGVPAVVTRLCDGNPDAVKRSDIVTSQDTSGSSNICPANQVGVVSESRDMTVTTNYACIDHAVAVASQSTVYGAWVGVSYCRRYIPGSCSEEPLSNREADGRYDWMVKCAPTVSVIKEFLQEFASVKIMSGDSSYGIGDKGRVLYANFMQKNHNCKVHTDNGNHYGWAKNDIDHSDNRNKNCGGRKDDDHGDKDDRHEDKDHGDAKNCDCDIDVPWIAPTDPKMPCLVPADVYISGVCVSTHGDDDDHEDCDHDKSSDHDKNSDKSNAKDDK